MSRHLRHLLVVTIFLAPSVSVLAQENSAAPKNVDRVIKLRSSEQPTTPEVKASNVSSRPVRVARQTLELPNPNQIQFDKINRGSMPSAQPLTPTKLPTANVNTAPEAQPVSTRGTAPRKPATAAATRLAPQISTRIFATKIINVHQQTTMRVQIQNESRQPAQNVKLYATLPTHAKFITARPTPTKVDGQVLMFDVYDIDSLQSRDIEIELVPTEKRSMEIGTQVVLTDGQQFAVSVRQPELRYEVTGAQQSNTGKWMSHVVAITNVGDGVAQNVQLTRIPNQAMYIEPNQMEYNIRSLIPGTTERIEVKTFAQQAGKFDLGFNVGSDTIPAKTVSSAVTVFQPELHVEALGPNVNFVNRDGVYSIQLNNSGKVDVNNVKVGFSFPEGFEVGTISREASINPETGTLQWVIERIPANSNELIQLRAVSRTPGDQTCTIEIASDETQVEQIQLRTKVIARPDVQISLDSNGGPVEVGGRQTFSLNLTNKGSSTARKVEVLIEMASELAPVANDNYFVNENANTIRFGAVDIAPGESRTIEFATVGVAGGEHVVRSTVTVEGSKRSLIAEDSVYVFETDQSKVSESLEPTVHRK